MKEDLRIQNEIINGLLSDPTDSSVLERLISHFSQECGVQGPFIHQSIFSVEQTGGRYRDESTPENG